MIYFKETEIGGIGIEEAGGKITQLVFKNDTRKIDGECGIYSEENASPVLKEAFKQLDEYFEGSRTEFDLPLAPEGTPFMKKVWAALCEIPYGKTATYKEIAEAAGSPKAYRAVGSANNRNPISIIIPCHRVIGCNGKLVGYAGGTDIKNKLLLLENKQFCEK